MKSYKIAIYIRTMCEAITAFLVMCGAALALYTQAKVELLTDSLTDSKMESAFVPAAGTNTKFQVFPKPVAQ